MPVRRWRSPLLAGLAAAALTALAVVFLLPYVLMEGAIRRVSADAGLNHMTHGPLPTAARQPVVRPSPDLAYSACPFDLSSAPLDIRVVPIAGRYSSLSVFDGRTDVVFVRNDVEAGGRPYRLILARPGQNVPDGVEVVRVNHDRGIALIRLLLRTPQELPALEGQRQLSSCASLAGGN